MNRETLDQLSLIKISPSLMCWILCLYSHSRGGKLKDSIEHWRALDKLGLPLSLLESGGLRPFGWLVYVRGIWCSWWLKNCRDRKQFILICFPFVNWSFLWSHTVTFAQFDNQIQHCKDCHRFWPDNVIDGDANEWSYEKCGQQFLL